MSYKYRVQDPRLGRFLSIDPLAAKYPWNSPYAFSENRVINAIELEGLEAFFVHGTRHRSSAWRNPELELVREELLKLATYENVDMTFNWKRPFEDAIYKNGNYNRSEISPRSDLLNWQKNNVEDRRLAALLLVDHIIHYREKNNITDEDITLIGYSHGGNVAIQAADILYNSYGTSVNIITVNTPAYNDEDDPENPFNYWPLGGINDMAAFYTSTDNVAGGLAPYSDDFPNTAESSFFGVYEVEAAGGDFAGISDHFLENVQSAEISKYNPRKLNRVPERERNPKDKKAEYYGKKQ